MFSNDNNGILATGWMSYQLSLLQNQKYSKIWKTVLDQHSTVLGKLLNQKKDVPLVKQQIISQYI